jgi:hypothetical protein
LYCAVEWGVLTEDEAFKTYDKLGEVAGEDNELSLEELKSVTEDAA